MLPLEENAKVVSIWIQLAAKALNQKMRQMESKALDHFRRCRSHSVSLDFTAYGATLIHYEEPA
jgi:hypothetical protein